MQHLDVISINLWEIIISLLNLVIIFFILKKVLWKRVKAIIAKRNAELAEKYNAADMAEHTAAEHKKEWEEKLATADTQADEIIKTAVDKANIRSEKIISDAKKEADGMIGRAENEIALEKIKARDDMKREIADVSAVLAEKLIGREMNDELHRSMIDTFIDDMGDGND